MGKLRVFISHSTTADADGQVFLEDVPIVDSLIKFIRDNRSRLRGEPNSTASLLHTWRQSRLNEDTSDLADVRFPRGMPPLRLRHGLMEMPRPVETGRHGAIVWMTHGPGGSP
jgi:hypothetical protein